MPTALQSTAAGGVCWPKVPYIETGTGEGSPPQKLLFPDVLVEGLELLLELVLLVVLVLVLLVVLVV